MRASGSAFEVHENNIDPDTADRNQMLDQGYLHDGWLKLPDGRVEFGILAT